VWTLVQELLAATILFLFFHTSLRFWSLFVNFYSFGLLGLTLSSTTRSGAAFCRTGREAFSPPCASRSLGSSN